jgi:hypothetical protein
MGLMTFYYVCLSDGVEQLPPRRPCRGWSTLSRMVDCPGFLRVLYNTLIHLGYDGDAPVYHCRLSMAHGLDMCEVSVMIPFDPTKLWSGSVIGSEPNTGVEMMVHIALTYLCEDHLAATVALSTTLLPVHNKENLVWQKRLEAVSNLEGPHFHIGMTLLVRYA